MRSMDVAPRLACLALASALVVAAGCAPPVSPSGGRPGGAGGGGGAGPGSGGAGGRTDGPGFNPPISGDARPAGDGGEGSCAFQAHAGERVPVDLVLLLDVSGSMAMPVGARTRWELVQDAIVAFLADPRSAGLGVGLQFFPSIGKGTPCTTPADCGYPGPNAIAACEQRQLCIGAGVSPAMAMGCGRFDPVFTCPTGTTCTALGSCSMTGRDCINVGAACPGGVAGNVCRMQPTTCGIAMPSCDPASYERLAVPIAALPGAQNALVRALGLRAPGADTPMEAAALGVIGHLIKHLGANPGRRAAMVIATDGLPAGCGTSGISVIGDALWSARNGSPPVSSYVIGVFTAAEAVAARRALDDLASAGGTGRALVVEPGANLTERLQEGLAEIRGQALPCEYTIPRDRVPSIDFGKVNVHFKGTSGEEDVPYVGRADRCHPMRGGWYYDADPAAGGTPTRVVVCPASCTRFKGDASARVELRFGCKTVIIE
jgi:hypothetical protein